jgi:hypothetical protein
MKKNYIFLCPSDLFHYEAEAFVVRCLDDRFREAVEKFLSSRGIGYRDAESPAGGGKIFSDPEKETDRDFMVREIEKSVRLHGTRRVVFSTHHDCGAYGSFARFGGDEDKEFLFHREEHERARRFLWERFPEMTIESYFIDEKGIVKTS